MKKNTILFLISCITILLFGLVSCNQKPEKPVALTVSAAAVYRQVLPKIDQLYKQAKPNVAITYNFGGSGVLREQIEQGVPVDIFIPAIADEMNILQAKGMIIPETRQDLTKNSIVLIVSKDSTLPISNFQDLSSDEVKRVALGTENLASGRFAKRFLTSLGNYEQVKKKGVFAGEDVGQILRYVETKNADAGILFVTDAKRSEKVKIAAIASESSLPPAISPVAVLKGCKNITAAQEYIQFLQSDRTTPIFEKYGFTKIKS